LPPHLLSWTLLFSSRDHFALDAGARRIAYVCCGGCAGLLRPFRCVSFLRVLCCSLLTAALSRIVALFSLFQYLYTLKVTDQAKADKIAQSFPTSLKKEVL
jgi:hypothetical protein